VAYLQKIRVINIILKSAYSSFKDWTRYISGWVFSIRILDFHTVWAIQIFRLALWQHSTLQQCLPT